jgi:hypothetical protein
MLHRGRVGFVVVLLRPPRAGVVVTVVVSGEPWMLRNGALAPGNEESLEVCVDVDFAQDRSTDDNVDRVRLDPRSVKAFQRPEAKKDNPSG